MNFKIISYNICALPYYINLYGDPHKRINNIIKFLKRLSADVICLQEVFDKKIRKKIIDKLSKNYKIYYNEDKSRFKFNDGLMILTKNKILYKKSIKYKNSCGEDSFSTKGIIYITIKHKINNRFKKITIVNTHLNANAIFSTKNICEKVRIKQIKQLNNTLKNIKNNILLCGDLNIDINNNINTYKSISSHRKYIIKSDRIITCPNDKKQLDYIFYMSLTKINFVYNYKIYKNKYSDHYPLELKIGK